MIVRTLKQAHEYKCKLGDEIDMPKPVGKVKKEVLESKPLKIKNEEDINGEN